MDCFAGLNPQSLRGTKTGVFVGCSSAETQDILIRDPETTVGYSLTGCQHSMFANRLSFTFDFTGNTIVFRYHYCSTNAENFRF